MTSFEISKEWNYHNLEKKIKDFDNFYKKNLNSKEQLVFDFTSLDEIDSSGIILIIKYLTLFSKKYRC